VRQLEPFDEHEEWQEKCNHYMIALGGKGALASLPSVRLCHLRHFIAECLPTFISLCPSFSTPHLSSSPLPPQAVSPSASSTVSPTAATVLTRVGNIAKVSKPMLLDAVDSWTVSRRFGHAACRIDGHVVAFGGTGGAAHHRLNDALLFSAEDSRHFNVHQLGHSANGDEPPSARMHHTLTAAALHSDATASVGSAVSGGSTGSAVGDASLAFLFGGRNSPSTALGDAYTLSLDRADGSVLAMWKKITPSGQAPEARWRHTCSTFDTNMFAIVGGSTPEGLAPAGVAVLSLAAPERPMWLDVVYDEAHNDKAKALATTRTAHSAATVGDDTVFVYGGLGRLQLAPDFGCRMHQSRSHCPLLSFFLSFFPLTDLFP
jgi:hypothetical protein